MPDFEFTPAFEQEEDTFDMEQLCSTLIWQAQEIDRLRFENEKLHQLAAARLDALHRLTSPGRVHKFKIWRVVPHG